MSQAGTKYRMELLGHVIDCANRAVQDRIEAAVTFQNDRVKNYAAVTFKNWQNM
jgi:hypothetical protein